MTIEIPAFGLKAYALFFSKYGATRTFRQSELDWIVGPSMKKKIFSLLVRSGWIRKQPGNRYVCVNPAAAVHGLLEFRVPGIMKKAEKEYSFTRLSAIEIWSDYSYVQRGIEKSPYYISVLKKDMRYWKNFFNRNGVSHYTNEGSTIGEHVILIPVTKLKWTEKYGLKVEPLKEAMRQAKANDIYAYAYSYMRKKYGRPAT
ncbi:MAG: hypothetical protein AABW68_05435 [archaeon]